MPEAPTNWESLKALLADALELTPDQRDAFLVQTCNGDTALLGEARNLILAYEQTDGVIDRRTDAWLGLGGPDLLSLNGQRIGQYKLDRLLAEGAMATVYLAKQNNPSRTVAVKLLRSGLLMTDVAMRFKRESQALGQLQHPHIARIYEAGVHRDPTSSGIPFIAMEYVDGPPLTVFAQKNKLSRVDRIKLLIKVAQAVHAAHQQAIIHRDLKPANVLVDSTGEPKVLDFGIAHMSGEADEQNTWQTTAGVLLGTPGYMSPEQASGKLDTIDVRSDVWGLGVMLHELLTDRLPIDVKNTSIAEAIRRIENAELQPIGRIDKTLKGDLETIVSTALAKEKEGRYASAEAMANDLKRVLDYEPISARPPSRSYRFKKFIRRHRFGAVMTLVTIALVLGGGIASSIGFFKARQERDRARQVNSFLLEMLSKPDPNIGSKDITVVQAMQSAEGLITTHFASDPETEAAIRSTLGWTYYNLGLYDRSVEQLTRCVALRHQLGRDGDRETLDDTTRLVTAIRWQYKAADALKVLEPAYQTARKELGELDPTTLSLMDNYAGVLADLGRYDEADPMYKRVVELSEQVLGAKDQSTLTAMNNYAALLINLARWKEAESLLRKVIDLRSKDDRGARVAYVTNRHNLAITISAQGRLDEALKQYELAIADGKELLGEDHSRTLSAQVSYADALLQAGRFDESLALNQSILERRRRLLGDANEQTLISMHNTINGMLATKKFADAETMSRRLIADVEKYSDQDDLVRIAAKQDLAIAMAGLKRNHEAEPLQREVIAAYTKKFGPDNPRVLIQQNNLVPTLLDLDRGEDALALINSIGESLKRQPYAPLAIAYQRNLARTYAKLRRYQEAESTFKVALQLSENAGNATGAAEVAAYLESLYTAWGKPELAQQWHLRATSARSPSTLLPATNPSTQPSDHAGDRGRA